MNDRLVILVAEDDANDLELLRHAVRQNGVIIDVHVVSDGEDAIQYLRGGGSFANRALHPLPDLIVLDLKMPRVSGLEALEWIRDHRRYARIPVIMLSGSGLDPDIQEAYRLGVNTYFTKPAELKKLRELIAVLIDYWARSQRPVHNS